MISNPQSEQQDPISVPPTLDLPWQQGQNADNWQPRVIRRKGLPFRDSKAVPSKG
jgi:hypothetical protein